MNAKTSESEARSQRLETIANQALKAAEAIYDSGRHLIRMGSPEAPTYRPAGSLPYAEALCASRDPAQIAEAARILDAVLDSQMRDPHHPHYGNWLWLADDTEVEDLNAVYFITIGLLPILARYEDVLPDALLERCRESVRLSLEEVVRINLSPIYSNIYLMGVFALLVGGQWLGMPHLINAGKESWQRFVDLFLESGAPHEYNSTTYGASMLNYLALLVEYVEDVALKMQLRLFYERVWWHLTLHLHQPTGQLAGPHSRSYWWPMLTGQNPIKDILWRETGWEWLLEPGPYGGRPVDKLPVSLQLARTKHWIPDYLKSWLQVQVAGMPYEVIETANAAAGVDLTSYYTPSYALGSTSKTFGIGTECFFIEHEANHLMLHYARPEEDEEAGNWGMMYSRFVVNDEHWGKKGPAPDRPKTGNFYDQGNFASAQYKNKAIALYALKPQHEQIHSLKTVVAFQSGANIDEVRIDNRLIAFEDLPVELQPNNWLVITDGAVHVGIKPLEHSWLGTDAPIMLEAGPEGELWLTIYNYRGRKKRFWEYASLGGAFWQGNLRAGFIVEVMELLDCPEAESFLRHLQKSSVHDTVDENKVRKVTYTSGDDSLTLQYDLMNTQPLARYRNGELYTPAQLHSPLAVQGDTGTLTLPSATLVTNAQPMWLAGQELQPGQRTWLVINPQDKPTPLRLYTPQGTVQATSFGMGRMIWQVPDQDPGTLTIECLREPENLQVPQGVNVLIKPKRS